jgi:hypothetical protein
VNVIPGNIVLSFIPVRDGRTHGRIINMADSTTYQNPILRATEAVEAAVAVVREAGVEAIRAMVRGGAE